LRVQVHSLKCFVLSFFDKRAYTPLAGRPHTVSNWMSLSCSTCFLWARNTISITGMRPAGCVMRGQDKHGEPGVASHQAWLKEARIPQTALTPSVEALEQAHVWLFRVKPNLNGKGGVDGLLLTASFVRVSGGNRPSQQQQHNSKHRCLPLIGSVGGHLRYQVQEIHQPCPIIPQVEACRCRRPHTDSN